MLVRLIAVALSLISVVSFSQKNDHTDSLAALAKAAQGDTSKVLLLNNLVLILREKNPNEALVMALKAKTLSDSLHFRRGLGNTLQNIGWIYYRKGDFAQALKYSLEALSINKEFGDKTLIANCLNNIGAIQYEQKQYASAVSYFKQGYALSREIHNSTIMSRSLNNISFCYISLKKLDSAEYFVRIAIDEGGKTDDSFKTGFSQRILGDIYFEKQQWHQALESYTRCLQDSRKRNQNSLIVSTLHRIGRTYLRLRLPDTALKYLNENVEKAKALGYKNELEKTYALLTEAYIQKHNLAKAFWYQSLFIEVHDSLFNQNQTQQIAQMESRYKDEIKEARIALLTKDSELQSEEIKTQRSVIYSIFIGLALLAVLAFVQYNSKQRVKRANQELAEKNEQVKIQAEQLSHLNTTKDKLFSIIAHDLRSPLGGLRSTMDLLSRGILSQEEFNTITRQLKLNLDYLHDDLDNLLNWAYTQLGGLEPHLEYVSLHEEIMNKVNLFGSICKAKGIAIDPQLPDGFQVHMDRNHLGLIIRNLISNAIKFSHPNGMIIIKTGFQSGKVILSVEDFGLGMSEDEAKKLFTLQGYFSKPGTQKEKGTGLGLMLVKEFVDKCNGSIRVSSHEGRGSIFIVEMTGKPVNS